MITQLISSLVHFSTTPLPPSGADVIDGSPLIANGEPNEPNGMPMSLNLLPLPAR